MSMPAEFFAPLGPTAVCVAAVAGAAAWACAGTTPETLDANISAVAAKLCNCIVFNLTRISSLRCLALLPQMFWFSRLDAFVQP
jgi:hypothetical protein